MRLRSVLERSERNCTKLPSRHQRRYVLPTMLAPRHPCHLHRHVSHLDRQSFWLLDRSGSGGLASLEIRRRDHWADDDGAAVGKVRGEPLHPCREEDALVVSDETAEFWLEPGRDSAVADVTCSVSCLTSLVELDRVAEELVYIPAVCADQGRGGSVHPLDTKELGACGIELHRALAELALAAHKTGQPFVRDRRLNRFACHVDLR